MVKCFRNYYFVFLLISTSSTFGFTESDTVLGNFNLDSSYPARVEILSKLVNKESKSQSQAQLLQKNNLDKQFFVLYDNQDSSDGIGFDKPSAARNIPVKFKVLDKVIYKRSESPLDNPWAKKSNWERINSSNDEQNFKNYSKQNFNVNDQHFNIKCDMDLPF